MILRHTAPPMSPFQLIQGPDRFVASPVDAGGPAVEAFVFGRPSRSRSPAPKSSVNSHLSGASYLQGDVRVQLKGRHLVCPRQELLRVRIDVVVKDRPLRGELDRFKLVDPPFAELDPIIHKLSKNENQAGPSSGRRGRLAGGGLPRGRLLTWSWNMAPPNAQKQANTK